MAPRRSGSANLGPGLRLMLTGTNIGKMSMALSLYLGRVGSACGVSSEGLPASPSVSFAWAATLSSTQQWVWLPALVWLY